VNNTYYEHFVVGEVDFGGVTEREIQEQCEHLFLKAPMAFIPRKGVKVDLEIKRMVDEMGITIPIIWIKGTLYLVGINKIHMEMKAEDVIAQIGGGYEKFELYIKKNHKILERGLLIKMIQSKESLEWIVDSLMKNNKIPTGNAVAYDSSTNYYNDARQLQGSRIQIARRVSSRVTKDGLMIGGTATPTRNRERSTFSSGNSSGSPLRSPLKSSSGKSPALKMSPARKT